jgi:pyrimidine deaminase RibD-like protein
MKILLVNDNYELLDVLKDLLARLRNDVEIDEAMDGDEAFLLYCRRGPYDLVLTDDIHPGLGGIDFVKAIRRKDRAQPIAFLTHEKDIGKTLWQKFRVPSLRMPFESRELGKLLHEISVHKHPVPHSVLSQDDRHFALMAIEEALRSVSEDERPHPKVGAVVIKGGKVLSRAHRGENPKSHAEYIALDAKLSDELIAGATVYTTLEPCTTRKHPKIPCAQRLVDRKVARVVIGMLDPNPDIRGLGDQMLSDANIETQLFPRDLRAQVEEMNREFIRAQRQKQAAGAPGSRPDFGR